MYLTELFNRAVDWKYTNVESKHSRAEFNVDEYEYTVDFMNNHEINSISLGGPAEDFKDLWEVNFTTYSKALGSRDDITGTGNTIAVFSTVINIVESTIKQQDIQSLVFTSDSDEPSRISLYDRMAKNFAKSGWRYIDNREIRARSRGRKEYHLFLLTKQPHPHSQIPGTKA